VVANMFFIPLGIFLGTPGLTVGLYIWKGIIPSMLGNVLGGAFFMAGFYYYMHILGQPDIAIDGKYYDGPGARSAVGSLERMEEGTLTTLQGLGTSTGSSKSSGLTSSGVQRNMKQEEASPATSETQSVV